MKPAILLVDDDLFLLTLTAELLSELGYRVTTAAKWRRSTGRA